MGSTGLSVGRTGPPKSRLCPSVFVFVFVWSGGVLTTEADCGTRDLGEEETPANMDFIILTVNGVDVSQCSHEEAVQRFLEASEPIMVEVKRRTGKGNVSQTTEAKVLSEVEEEQES